MPFLPEAVASVEAQTYRNFELVVQDCSSTDGSLEFLQSVTRLPRIEIDSESDGGLGDAYNRAIARCGGDIIGTIDADNMLEPDALEHVVAFMDQHPECAAVYGGSHMVSPEGRFLHSWMPAEFAPLPLLECALVPPFAVSFFSRSVCGNRLRFDERLKTCADFGLWLQISHLPIRRIERYLGSTRVSEESMTRRPETYDQHLADKTGAVVRYVAAQGDSPLLDAVRDRALAGIWLWGAESVFALEGKTERFDTYLERAVNLGPDEARLARLRAKVACEGVLASET